MSIDSSIGELQKDPNFILIIVGTLLWMFGILIPFIGPIFSTTGFGLVCTASAVTALQRSSENATFGLIFGGILHIVGTYLLFLPFVGSILVAIGSVFIIYFAIPLAIQTGKVPFIEEIQKKFDAQRAKEEVIDAEVIDEEPEDSEDDSSEEITSN